MNNICHEARQPKSQIRAWLFDDQIDQLNGIEKRTGIDRSAVLRLALDILLPRLKNENVKDIDKRLEEIFKQ